jgi:Leucine-rich repeat (LRR) protein
MDNQQLLETIKQAAKDKVTVLHLFNQELTTLPPELFELHRLEELGLSNN